MQREISLKPLELETADLAPKDLQLEQESRGCKQHEVREATLQEKQSFCIVPRMSRHEKRL